MRFLARVVALILPLAVLFTSCDEGSTDVGTGRVSVVLRDAPGDVKSAVVTISKVYLQGSAGELLLTDAAVTIDLLTLQNDFKTLVDAAVIPAGSYSQLRFVIDGAYIEVEDEVGGTIVYATDGYKAVPDGADVAGTLHTPSLDASGLKVNLDGGAIRVDGEQKILLVDFDVRESFGRAAGNAGQWVMDPVMRAIDVELTGRVKVEVEVADGVRFPPVAGAPVTLGDLVLRLESESGAESLLKLTAPGNKVTAEIGYLFPGTYKLELLAPGSIELETTPPLPMQVEVGSGGVAENKVRITKATTGLVQ